MKYNKDYFYIQIKHLKEGPIYPFQIHVYNNVNHQHTLYLHANSPLDKQKKQLLEYIIERGGEIAIKRKQSKTFLQAQKLSEADIPSLGQRKEHQLEKNQKMYQHLYEQRKEAKAFIFDHELKSAVNTDDFSEIIEQVKSEVLTFEVTSSSTISLAIFLAEALLTEDNYTNRIVAISYYVAKTINILDQEALADLIVASLLAHIGLTQVERSVFQGSLTEMPAQTNSSYKKHPALSQHLLRKSGVKLTDRCLKTIIEHHERADGSGYPNNKVEEYIEPLALVLGAVSHIFEHTIGLHDGNKRGFDTVITNIRNQSVSSGLELGFGDKILNGIEGLLK